MPKSPLRAGIIPALVLVSGSVGAGPPPLLWTDEAGMRRQAVEAVQTLDRASEQGLDPQDYITPEMEDLLRVIREGGARDAILSRFDQLLTDAMLRFLRDVHQGRADPRANGFAARGAAETHDFVQRLYEAVGADRVAAAVEDVEPPLVQYRLLKAALVRYRTLSARPQAALPAGEPLRGGDRREWVRGLRAQLVMLGDLLPAGSRGPADDVYDDAVVEGIRRFQLRHGLEPDGVIGPRTLAALNVPLSWRVRQLEMALERLRWLPELGEQRFMAVNIPMFQLWAWDAVRPTGEPALAMRAIVGRARITQSPMLTSDLKAVVFRPYWNVPLSIARGEIVPRIEKEPAYPDRNQFEIVDGPGDDAPRVAPTPGNLARVKRGELRIRQIPGPRNALGLIKFEFPNDESVYLHGTPAPALFRASRRDFSHGCIRLEDPAALAAWVLRDQPEWSPDRIEAAMAGTATIRVPVPERLPVILFYMTAAVMPEDGTVRFSDDIYGHDRTLDRSLRQRRPAPAGLPARSALPTWQRP